MREAYVTDGIDASVLRREAVERTGPTMIHYHSYSAECDSSDCCLVLGTGPDESD